MTRTRRDLRYAFITWFVFTARRYASVAKALDCLDLLSLTPTFAES